MVEIVDKTVRGPAARSRGAVGRPQIDVQRLAAAIAGPNLDTRTWLASGTVGILDELGTFKTGFVRSGASKDEKEAAAQEASDAVFVDPDGCVVSVQLEPSGIMITASWDGASCGRFGFVLFPIRAGDEVQVAIPDGDFNSDAIEVVRILSNRTAQIPSDWNNDRVLFDLNVPMEIRGPAVRITSANLVLNGRKVNVSPEDI